MEKKYVYLINAWNENRPEINRDNTLLVFSNKEDARKYIYERELEDGNYELEGLEFTDVEIVEKELF